MPRKFLQFSYVVGEGDEQHEIKLPVGCRFMPKDHELILNYLVPNILDQKLPIDVIKDIDFYNDSVPSQLPIDDFKYGERNNEAFYFSPIKPEYTTSWSKRRSTGFGYWKTSEEDEEIVHENEVIGFKKTLVFYYDNNVSTRYVMHEYRAFPPATRFQSLDASSRAKMEGYVLCRKKLQ